MKNMVFIGGTMGVGKTATSRYLQEILPDSVFLDGDWCWDMKPFIVNDETKAMVQGNIEYLLNAFLKCSAYENVIFCWVMHQQEIIGELLSHIDEDYALTNISLTCSPEALKTRILSDANRDNEVYDRSVVRLGLYDKLDTVKIDVSDITARDAAVKIAELVNNRRG